MVIFYGDSKSSIVGNKEYKANNDMIYSLFALYSLFPLCETFGLRVLKIHHPVHTKLISKHSPIAPKHISHGLQGFATL